VIPNIPEDSPIEPMPSEKEAERPLECNQCKKPIAVNYTEIVGDLTSRTCMCNDCPVLQQRLFGIPRTTTGEGQFERRAGLACGNCGTTLEAIKVGNPLGCSVCYEVFEEILLPELNSRGKISPRLVTAKKSQALHMGRGYGETQEISSSMRLLALNEALSETLQREDYEQAAWLRDQIKALTEAKDDNKPNEEPKDGTS
jgi:protein arginine kinase activator